MQFDCDIHHDLFGWEDLLARSVDGIPSWADSVELKMLESVLYVAKEAQCSRKEKLVGSRLSWEASVFHQHHSPFVRMHEVSFARSSC